MSFVQSVSTLGVFTRTLGNVETVQKELFNLQDQISSGFKSRNFEGIATQTEHFTALEGKIKRASQYEENLALGVSRLKTMDIAMQDALEIMDDLEDLIVLARNPSTRETIEFEGQVNSLKEQLASTLNQSFKGYYLFGGTRTDVEPVITDPIPEGTTPGALSNAYYQGAAENNVLRADERIEIEYDIRADDDAFQRAFAALALASRSTNDSSLAQAQEFATAALEDINTLRAELNADIVYAEDVSARHENLRLYWQGVSEEIINTDIVAASSKVAQDQAILQASFQAFATINQLRLSDFL